MLGLLGAALLVAVCVPLPPLAAQPPPDDDVRASFVDAVQVRVVEVEVVVTDRDGRPVRGLSAEDFELFQDGEPVAITNFFAVEPRGVAPEVAPGQSSPSGSTSPQPSGAEPRPTFLVLLFDDLTLPPGERRRLIERLRDPLPRLVAMADGVMVAHADRRVEIECGFTRDIAELEAALERAARWVPSSSSTLARSTVIRDIERAVLPPASSAAAFVAPGAVQAAQQAALADAMFTLSEVRSYAEGRYFAMQRFQRELRSFVDSLVGLPGRKAVLFVSDGIDLRPGEALYRTWWNKFQAMAPSFGLGSIEGEIQQHDFSLELGVLTDHANSNGVVFYTLDAAGLDSESRSPEVRNRQFAVAQEVAGLQQSSTLQVLANGTGGLSLLHSTNVDHLLDGMQQSFESYYSLGFDASVLGRGTRRRLRVEVRGDGLAVRYAKGWVDKSSAELMLDRTLASVYLEVVENPLQVRVELGEATAARGRVRQLPVTVKVPIANLALLPEADRHRGQLSVIFVARDERGTSQPARASVPISIAREDLREALEKVAAYEARLAVRNGEQRLAVSVQDEIGRVYSTVLVELPARPP